MNIYRLITVTIFSLLYASNIWSSVANAKSLEPFFARYERANEASFQNTTPASVESIYTGFNNNDAIQIEMRLYGSKSEFFIDRFYLNPKDMSVIGRDFARTGDRPEFDYVIENNALDIHFRRGTAAVNDSRNMDRVAKLNGPVYDPGLAPYVVALRSMQSGDSYTLNMLYSGFQLTEPVIKPATVKVGKLISWELPSGKTAPANKVSIEFEFPNGQKQSRSYILSKEPPYLLSASAGSHWRLTTME